MCGRYTVRRPEHVIDHFGPSRVEFAVDKPRYNIAPSQTVPVLLMEQGRLVLRGFRWGLVPAWADDPAIGNRMINARADSVAEKASFKEAFQRRRCLVPADGFYEWAAAAREKQPLYIRVDGGEPFAFAGLYEIWHTGRDDEICSCTIITTDANKLLQRYHPRMPVILPTGAYGPWLDEHRNEEPKPLLELLQPFDDRRMDAYPVGRHVNSPRHDDPQCIEPASDEPKLFDDP
jgi:putative SOS response-associated peptidase YedK